MVMMSSVESPCASPGVISGPSSASSPSAPVYVFLTAGYGLVWNADSARILREKYFVIGAMGGTLVQFRQQNVAKGLPLLLSAEEVRLALDKGWITLLAGGVEALNPELQDRIRSFKAAENMRSNVTLRGEDSLSAESDFQPHLSREPHLDEHVEASQGSDKEAADANWPHDKRITGTHTTTETRSATSISGPVTRIADLSLSDVTSELHPKRDPSSTVYTHKLLVPLAGGLSRHPAQPPPPTGQHALMLAVMSDLNSRGYRVTDGTKFGADYLAYPGDPSEFHSQYAVRVLEEDDVFQPMEILGGARVALGARKRFVIASRRGGKGNFQEPSCCADVVQGDPTREAPEDMGEVRVTASESLPTDSTAVENKSEEEGLRGREDAPEIDGVRAGLQDVGEARQGWDSDGIGGQASNDVDIGYITLATDLDFVPRKKNEARPKRGQWRGGRGRGATRGRGGLGAGGMGVGEGERKGGGHLDVVGVSSKT